MPVSYTGVIRIRKKKIKSFALSNSSFFLKSTRKKKEKKYPYENSVGIYFYGLLDLWSQRWDLMLPAPCLRAALSRHAAHHPGPGRGTLINPNEGQVGSGDGAVRTELTG